MKRIFQMLLWGAAMLPICIAGPEAATSRTAALQRLPARNMIALAQADTGKVVMINTWATWCGECRNEMPALLRLRREFPASEFSLYLFSADEPEDSIKAVQYLDSLGVDFQTYLKSDTTDEEFITAFDSTWSGALPTTLVFNRHGNRVEQLVGSKTFEKFEQIVKKYR